MDVGPEKVTPPAPMKGPQTSKGIRRHSLILKVAAHLFAERGYDKVSIHDIGVAAGVTGTAIYRYFPSKEALLVSAFDHLYRLAREGFGNALAEAVTDREVLEKLIDHEIFLVTEEPEKIRIADSEGRHLPVADAARLHLENRQHLKLWSSALRKVRPEFTPDQADITVHALLAMINSANKRRNDAPLPPAIQNHLRDLAHRMVFDS